MLTGLAPLEESRGAHRLERAVRQDSGDRDLVATGGVDREEEASVGTELERALRGDPGPGFRRRQPRTR